MGKKKKVWIIVAVAVLIAASLLAYYVFSGSSVPDPTLQSKTAIAKYLASDEFSKLSKEERLKYLNGVDMELKGEILPREGLSEDEKKKLRENMAPLMRERFNNRIKEYFKLSPEEKKAFLDKMADEFQKRAEGAARNRGTASGGTAAPNSNSAQQGTPKPQGPSADQIRNWVEKTPPEDKARFTQFMKDAEARRAERAGAAAQQK